MKLLKNELKSGSRHAKIMPLFLINSGILLREVIKKDMKKKLAIILTLSMSMIFVTGLTGCSNNKEAAAEPVYDVNEHVELGEYKELPFYTEEQEVTDEELEQQIELILLYATETENALEGVVEDGDTINIAYTGKIDGETFEGGSSESYDLTVGTTSMIDGFVEGLIGKNVGETVTLDLRFPDDYQEESLQGKDVVFEITINSKRVSVTPELTDEFVKEYYDSESVDAFKEKLREDLLNDKVASMENSIKNDLWSVILEGSNIKSVPEDEQAAADAQIAIYEEDYKSQASMYGMEWEDFLTNMMGTDEAGFQDMLKGYSDSIIKNSMVAKALAKQEGISFTDSEFKARLKEILENNSLTEENFQSYYNMTIEEYAEQNGWRDSFLLEKVMDKVLELGKEVSKEEYEAFIKEKLPREEEAEVIDEAVAEQEAVEEESEG